MSFKKGDYVKVVGDDKEIVYKLLEDVQPPRSTVKAKDRWGTVSRIAANNLEKAEGASAYFAAEQPNFMEIVQNGVSFALVQAVSRGNWKGQQTMTFIAEDAAYELLIKKMARDYVTDWMPENTKEVDLEAWFDQQDVYDALEKGIVVFLGIDTVKRLIFKQSQTGGGRLYYTLKGLVAFVIANMWQEI